MIDEVAQICKGQITEAFCGRLISHFIFQVTENPSKASDMVEIRPYESGVVMCLDSIGMKITQKFVAAN